MQDLSDALSDSDDRPDMTPLIDCMMVILLFFIVTSTFSESSAFPVELPPASHATLVASDAAVVVTVGKDGALDLGGRVIPADGLVAAIRAGLEAGQGTVIVRGDRAASYTHVVHAVDAAQAAGATRWALAVQP